MRHLSTCTPGTLREKEKGVEDFGFYDCLCGKRINERELDAARGEDHLIHEVVVLAYYT